MTRVICNCGTIDCHIHTQILCNRHYSFAHIHAEILFQHHVVYEDDPDSSVKICTKLVLAFKEGTKKPLVEVLPKLVKKLKPHQVEG